MVSVVISIGSNYGDKKHNVDNAIEWLRQEVLMQIKCSDIYETPCALYGQHSYYNAVISGFYQGTGEELEEVLKDKEKKMGRTSKMKEEKLVPIDLDIVIMNGEIVKDWDFRQKFFRYGYSQIGTP